MPHPTHFPLQFVQGLGYQRVVAIFLHGVLQAVLEHSADLGGSRGSEQPHAAPEAKRPLVGSRVTHRLSWVGPGPRLSPTGNPQAAPSASPQEMPAPGEQDPSSRDPHGGEVPTLSLKMYPAMAAAISTRKIQVSRMANCGEERGERCPSGLPCSPQPPHPKPLGCL